MLCPTKSQKTTLMFVAVKCENCYKGASVLGTMQCVWRGGEFVYYCLYNPCINVFLRLTGQGDTCLKLCWIRRRTSANTAQAPSPSLATTRQPTPYRWVSMANQRQRRNSWPIETWCDKAALLCFTGWAQCSPSEEFVFVKPSRPNLPPMSRNDVKADKMSTTNADACLGTLSGDKSEETGEAWPSQEGKVGSFWRVLGPGESSLKCILALERNIWSVFWWQFPVLCRETLRLTDRATDRATGLKGTCKTSSAERMEMQIVTKDAHRKTKWEIF